MRSLIRFINYFRGRSSYNWILVLNLYDRVILWYYLTRYSSISFMLYMKMTIEDILRFCWDVFKCIWMRWSLRCVDFCLYFLLRHGYSRRIVLDRGSENLDLTKDLLKHYKIQWTIVSIYHSQINDLVERRHDSIVDLLLKYCSKNSEEREKYLPLALGADRVSIQRSIGYSAFELFYQRDCLLSMDFALESWSVVDWKDEN